VRFVVTENAHEKLPVLQQNVCPRRVIWYLNEIVSVCRCFMLY